MATSAPPPGSSEAGSMGDRGGLAWTSKLGDARRRSSIEEFWAELLARHQFRLRESRDCSPELPAGLRAGFRFRSMESRDRVLFISEPMAVYQAQFERNPCRNGGTS
jgi:hypothetical protein